MKGTWAGIGAWIAIGCGGDLPHEDGVEWPCRVQAERGGLVVGSHPEDGPLWVCANSNVDPFDVRDQCEDDCESKWCTYGVTSSFPFLTFCTDATCTYLGDPPTPTGIECATGPDPGGPARAALTLEGTAVVTADGSSGTATGVTGILRYSIADCGATACPIHFAEIDLTVPSFDLDGFDVTASIHNGVNPVGVWYSDTKLIEFEAGAIALNANFTVDGDGGSVSITNDSTVVGILDPDADLFSLVAPFTQGDVTVDIVSLTGVHTNRPPQAVIAPASPIECTDPLAAAVQLDGTGSTDVDGNIERYEWLLDGTDAGMQAVVPAVLPFGTTEAELTVYDTLSAFDKTEATLEVVDTSPPDLSAPPDVVAECTSPLGTPVDIGVATASDVCDENFVLFDDGLVLYPLGETIVTWTAVDFSGNVAEAEQSVVIEDTTPPVLSVSVSPNSLWPPNHKLNAITATITVTDVCDAAPTVTLVSITSNEADNGLGDGDTANDIQNAATGTDDRAFDLRAERSGGGTGRTYTVTYEARDGSGNTTLAEATVVVPKSK